MCCEVMQQRGGEGRTGAIRRVCKDVTNYFLIPTLFRKVKLRYNIVTS
jgi:hypothetical protein